MEEEFRLLKTFQNPIDANITKGLLESNGIEAFIFDENMVYVNPVLTTAIGGVKLLVRNSDYENTSLLLKEIDQDNHKEELKKKCPSCGSSNIKVISKPNWGAFLIMLFSFASTPNTGNTKRYKCTNCDNDWVNSE
jgi:DNA-directed RNA polymerase subunit M/transcription elongation factor TFIIS